jgi:formate dehydrogenase subunit delta
MSTPESLVQMANQIARNLAVQGEARAVAATADHIRRFWDPWMIRRLAEAEPETAGAALDPIARAALLQLVMIPPS